MYVLTQRGTLQRGIATLLAVTLVLWAVGVHMFTNRAEAANLTSVSDTLTSSATSTPSNHLIQFTTPSGVAAAQTITVSFPAGFAMGSVGVGDIDLSIGGVDQPLAALAAGATWGTVVAGQTITFTSGTATATPGAVVIIKVGTNATGGVNQVTNPAATGSYLFNLSAGNGFDSAQMRVAIVGLVHVTAAVDATLTFTVSGTSTGITVNGSPTTTATTSSATSLPFGTLTPDVSKTLAQDLKVATNAIHGYVVTVQESGLLQSSTGATIDNFVDANNTQVPTAWVAPSNNVNNSNTWGHWGLTSTDGTTTRASQFTSNSWVAPSTTPIVVMGYTGPSDGVTPGIGYAQVGYQIQVTPLQEAGSDYNTTLTYIATPTF